MQKHLHYVDLNGDFIKKKKKKNIENQRYLYMQWNAILKEHFNTPVCLGFLDI